MRDGGGWRWECGNAFEADKQLLASLRWYQFLLLFGTIIYVYSPRVEQEQVITAIGDLEAC